MTTYTLLFHPLIEDKLSAGILEDVTLTLRNNVIIDIQLDDNNATQDTPKDDNEDQDYDDEGTPKDDAEGTPKDDAEGTPKDDDAEFQ